VSEGDRETRGARAPFAGFVTGGAATTLPAQLFVELLPAIEDEAELRVTLYALYAIQRQRGQVRAVRVSALAAEAPLQRTLERLGGRPAFEGGLAAAVGRGTLLACDLEDGDALVLVNNEAGRRSLDRVRSGGLELGGRVARATAPPERPVEAAAAYEQEIGPLTPAVAEALAAATERYPAGWIVDAIRLAALRNARSWRYADAVLRRWEAEGRDDDATAREAPERTAGEGRAGGRTSGDPYGQLFRRHWP
jgi:DnaD/phage-associated family protein